MKWIVEFISKIGSATIYDFREEFPHQYTLKLQKILRLIISFLCDVIWLLALSSVVYSHNFLRMNRKSLPLALLFHCQMTFGLKDNSFNLKLQNFFVKSFKH